MPDIEDSAANPWLYEEARFGALNCHLVRSSGPFPAREGWLFCHGYGASGDDLTFLAELLGEPLRKLGRCPLFIFPEALMDLTEFGMPGGRAWWPINMARLMELAQKSNFDEMRNQIPPGLDSARKALSDCFNELRLRTGIPTEAWTIGGFSQGAMLTTDFAIRGLTMKPKMLVTMSGAMICESVWRENQNQLYKLPIVQTHGRWDTVLPIQTGRWVHQLYQEAGAKVIYQEFEGPHTIPGFIGRLLVEPT
jgi:phospholipase/carboxylesterase